MIERYTRPEMAALWSDRARYEAWLEVELHACAAMERLGEVPERTTNRVRRAVKLDPARILEI